MVQTGELGDIRIIQAEYPQDWLTERIEATGQKQAEWRTDPAQAGAGGCVGDIGTHAYNLADFIVATPVKELCAELTTFVEGRRVDDNAQIMLRYANGARGALWSSQVAPGNENGLRIRVYGAKGGLEWNQVNPNYLSWSALGQPTQIIGRSSSAARAAATRVTRIPPGHPEGYLEGFANIYQEIAHAIRASRTGVTPDGAVTFPSIDDGVRGVAFIEAAVASSKAGAQWTSL